MFYIYSRDNPNYRLGKVKVTKLESTESICKVIEGEIEITNALNSGENLIAISIYTL